MSLSRFPLSLKTSLLSTIRSSSSLTRSRVAGIGDVKPLGTWIGKLINRNNTNNSKEEKDESVTKDETNVDGSGQEKEPRPPVDLESLQKILSEKDETLSQKDKEINELQDKYKRALAETENTRQRMLKQVQDAKLYGIQDFTKDIISVADVLETAIESVPSSQIEGKEANPSVSSLYDGLKMMETNLLKVFSKHGLTRIKPVGGDPFDPSFHEAMFQVPGEKPGTIGAVSKVGYVLNGRTVRPAMVGVVKDKD